MKRLRNAWGAPRRAREPVCFHHKTPNAHRAQLYGSPKAATRPSTGVFASKHVLSLGSGCHSMADPFDLIPSQNLFECKLVAPHMSGEVSGTMLRWVILHHRGFHPHAALPGLFLIKVSTSYTKTHTGRQAHGSTGLAPWHHVRCP